VEECTGKKRKGSMLSRILFGEPSVLLESRLSKSLLDLTGKMENVQTG